jgi:hypothetical protein
MTDVTPGEKQAPKGQYKLKAVWNEIVSELGKAREFVKHLPGDIVELSTADAERFLRHGVVTPITDEAKASAAAQAPTPADKAKAINDQVGAQPIAPGQTQQEIVNPVNATPAPPVTS